NGRDEVVIGDDTITVTNEVFQNVENLGCHSESLGSAPQLSAIGVQQIMFESVNQPPTPLASCQARHRKKQANHREKPRLSQRLPLCQPIGNRRRHGGKEEGTMTTKRGFLLALAASASISVICPAFAEVYPARPIT